MNDDDTLIMSADKVVAHEVAYWYAEQRLDAAMQQHMERLLAKVRTAELPVVTPPRAGCLGWLFKWKGG